MVQYSEIRLAAFQTLFTISLDMIVEDGAFAIGNDRQYRWLCRRLRFPSSLKPLGRARSAYVGGGVPETGSSQSGSDRLSSCVWCLKGPVAQLVRAHA